MSTIQAFPLQWPVGWPRAKERKRARFSKGEMQYSSSPGGSSWMRHREVTIADATGRLRAQLRTFGVPEGDSIISTNLELRLDGLPRSGQREPADPGVAVYWIRPGESMKVMAIDIYDRVADNLAAVAATLEAMRAIERHGGAQILERAFTGFTALPGPEGSVRTWKQILGFKDDAKPSHQQVLEAYRRRRSETHPDREGGNADEFRLVQDAYERGRAAVLR